MIVIIVLLSLIEQLICGQPFSGLPFSKMPRGYKKSNRQSWSEESMRSAVEAVLSKEMGYLKASQTFCLAQKTLEPSVKKARESGSVA
ncbi:hypothetical protein ILUMI_13063 [Ignelater luminosus]|uniref:HTH psq-type domain-containing protein n=1 Tax=Ignelater luminosus TaxID=2038154 RepID=A0A8K0CZ79_IGNLU|nr:hypothetical protein ILUMI_13063 [Ignelater luminosus]